MSFTLASKTARPALRLLGLATLLSLVGCEQAPAAAPYVPEQIEVEELRTITLTPYARLPEQDPSFRSVDVFPDRLVFHYDGAPEIVLEVDHVVSGIQGGGYLRRLTAVTDNGNGSWTIDTIPAELGELIQDGHFRVHMEPGTDSYRAPNGAAVEALDWSGPELPVGACMASSGGTVNVRPSIGANVGMDVDIDMRFCWRTGRFGIRYPAGCLDSAHFIASGSVSAGMEITTNRSVSVTCERDLIPEATANRLKREWTTTFAVGPVPIVLTHTLKPTASASITGTVSTGNTTLSASGRVGIRAGAQYRDGSWRRVWEPTGTGSTSVSTSECGAISVEGEVAAGIEYALKLYDAAGPEISYGPAVGASFEADFGGTEWTASVTAGLAGSIGASLEVPVLDITLASISWDLPEANLVELERTGPLTLCVDAGRDAGRDAGSPIDGGRSDAGMSTPRDAGVSRDAPANDTNSCQPLRTGCSPTAVCCDSSTDPSIQCIAGRCDDVDVCSEWDEPCSTGSSAPDRCCGGLQCARQSAGTAVSCCVAAAGVCRSASDCCGDMACTGGRCVARASGARCFSTFECGGSDVCRSDNTCGRPG